MEEIGNILPNTPVVIDGNTTTEFLANPEHYYEKLIDMIGKSNKKVILSALYLGTSALELKIIEQLEHSLSRFDDLEVTLILDYSRAMRKIRNPDGGFSSTLTITDKLIQSYHPRFRIYLYQMPQIHRINKRVDKFNDLWRKLTGFSAGAADCATVELEEYNKSHLVPSPIDEALGVYHCKYCLFERDGDESNGGLERTTILTGANLSEEYFSSRQDRYLVCTTPTSCVPTEVDPMAHFLLRFTATVTPHCYEVFPGGSEAKKTKETKGKNQPGGLSAGPRILLRLPEVGDKGLLQKDLATLTAGAERTADLISSDSPHISCHPLVQHHGIGLLEESTFLPRLIGARAAGGTGGSLWDRIVITTPYVSFSKAMVTSLVNFIELRSGTGASTSTVSTACPSLTLSPLEFVLPSLASHGFNSATGFKATIPQCHALMLGKVLDKLRREGATPGAETGVSEEGRWSLRWYDRPKWTYHAKGMWFYRRDGGVTAEPVPCATYLGSSNLGVRSWCRDFELGFLIVPSPGSAATTFGAQLKREVTNINLHSNEKLPIERAYENRNNKFPPAVVRVIARIIRSYL